LPAVFAAAQQLNGRAVIWLSEQGKSALFGDDGSPASDVKRLLEAGTAVFGVDLLFQGEFLAEERAAKNRSVKSPREFAGYTYGYNYSLLAERARDVLTMISFVKNNDHKPKSVELVALDGTAPIAAAALARCERAVDRAALDTRGVPVGKLTNYLGRELFARWSEIRRYSRTIVAGGADEAVLAGETAESAAVVKKAYSASGAADAIAFDSSKPDEAKRGAIEWILKSN